MGLLCLGGGGGIGAVGLRNPQLDSEESRSIRLEPIGLSVEEAGGGDDGRGGGGGDHVDEVGGDLDVQDILSCHRLTRPTCNLSTDGSEIVGEEGDRVQAEGLCGHLSRGEPGQFDLVDVIVTAIRIDSDDVVGCVVGVDNTSEGSDDDGEDDGGDDDFHGSFLFGTCPMLPKPNRGLRTRLCREPFPAIITSPPCRN